LPITLVPVGHDIAALAALCLFIVAAVVTTIVMPGPPRSLRATTLLLVVLVVIAAVLHDPLRLYPLTALEAIVIGLALLWMSTLVRLLAILAPDRSRPSEVRSPLQGL
ncbi:MAG: hypothetical protein WA971_00490, partial [Microbacterium sp.]